MEANQLWQNWAMDLPVPEGQLPSWAAECLLTAHLTKGKQQFQISKFYDNVTPMCILQHPTSVFNDVLYTQQRTHTSIGSQCSSVVTEKEPAYFVGIMKSKQASMYLCFYTSQQIRHYEEHSYTGVQTSEVGKLNTVGKDWISSFFLLVTNPVKITN
jgi:hypothetical protein